MTKRPFEALVYILLAGCCWLAAQTVHAAKSEAAAAGHSKTMLLDTKFNQFSAAFHAALVKKGNLPRFSDIHALEKLIEEYQNKQQTALATGTIINNLALVQKHVNDKPVIGIVASLLDANELKTAELIYTQVKAESDRSVVSNVAFAFARYQFVRNQWQQTINVINEIANDLPAQDFQHAMLMQGIALQELQKHREAMKAYNKVPNTSPYYTPARLNLAIANIRQDWWTDAHIIIDELLQRPDVKTNNAQIDRLYTVLGYSFLQQQYFRNSRDAFRNVSIDGPYTNQALLGIALTAAHQEDYIGALNAVNLLKTKKTRDLPVDEANLLVPYFYEKLHQHTTAAAGYSDAIKYYEDRIAAINATMQTGIDYFKRELPQYSAGRLILNAEVIEPDDSLPSVFFAQFRLLQAYQPNIEQLDSPALRQQFEKLRDEYAAALQHAAQQALKQKINHLTDYMNQSRYGLARMYDNSAVKAQ